MTGRRLLPSQGREQGDQVPGDHDNVRSENAGVGGIKSQEGETGLTVLPPLLLLPLLPPLPPLRSAAGLRGPGNYCDGLWTG